MEDNPMMQAERMSLLNMNKQGQRNFLDEMLRILDLDAADFAGEEDMLQALFQRTRELQASEKRLRIVAGYTYDWEYWLLPEGRMEYCSPSCKRITGYEVQEFLDDPGLLDRIVHPEDAHVWQAHWQAAENQPEHLHAIFRIIHRSGEEFWISHHCLAIFAEDGQYLGRRASNRNISARKQAEARLRKKNEELELYFTSSLDLLCIANVDGRFLRLNPEWERVLGYSVSDLEDRMFLDFVHPEDVQSTLAAVSRLENQEEVLNYVNRYRCKDGTYRWIEWRSRPVGRQIYAAARDITERKLAEAKLQESEENLARTLQSIGDGVISTDREGRVARMNPVAEKLCGWKESEAKGRSLGEVFFIVNAMTREALQDPVKKVFKTGRVVGLANHTLLLSRDGAEYQIADSAAPIKDRAGNTTGAVLVFRDVTREYAREKAIREEREQLLSVFNSIDGMIYISDPETYEILYVNNKLADLLPGDCIGSKCHKTLQGLEAPCGFCTNHIILGNTEPYRWDYYNPSLGRHFSIVDRIIKWSDGRDVRFEMAIDITERKRVEEALQIQKDRYGYILEGTNVGTWEWNVQTGEAIFNERFVGMAGYTLMELAPVSFKTWENLVQPDDLQASNVVLERHFQGETDFYECECRIRHKDGHWLWVLDRGKVISRTEEGKPLWVYGTHTDITKRKRAEEDAEKSRNLLQSVLDTIPVRVFWKDLNLRYLGCNMPFARDAGNDSPSELIGRDDFAMGWIDQAGAGEAAKPVASGPEDGVRGHPGRGRGP
jgi:PAS domain S-box-containing protein